MHRTLSPSPARTLPRRVGWFCGEIGFLVVAGTFIIFGCQRSQPPANPQTPASPPSQDAAVNPPDAWGDQVAGLAARIWTDKQSFDAVEPIVVHYAVKNVSQKPKTVWHSGFWPNHRIDVVGPDGQPAKLAAGGEARWSAFSPGGAREKNAPFVLQPGAVDDAYESYNLRDIVDMQTPGVYTVQYLYQDAKAEAVYSNRLQLTVKAPPR